MLVRRGIHPPFTACFFPRLVWMEGAFLFVFLSLVHEEREREKNGEKKKKVTNILSPFFSSSTYVLFVAVTHLDYYCSFFSLKTVNSEA